MKTHHTHSHTVTMPIDSSFYLLDNEFDNEFEGGTDLNTRLLPMDDEGRIREVAQDDDLEMMM